MSPVVRFMKQARLVVAGLLAFAAGCSAADGAAPQAGSATVPFHATFGAGVPVNILVVTVSGPGISPNLTFNIPIVGGTASGNITLPVGASRLIQAQVFDTSGVVLYTGSTTINVVAGVNPGVAFNLSPTVGTVPITAAVGAVTVTVPGASLLVRAGATLALTAQVRDGQGNLVAGPVLTWATSNPTKAWVDPTGLLTAFDTGTVTVAASTLGASGNNSVTVTAGTLVSAVGLTPSTVSSAAGSTITTAVSYVDVGPTGVDSVQVTVQPASGGPRSCTSVSPNGGTRLAGTFRCSITSAGGALPTGALTVSAVQLWWNGPTGGTTLLTPALLNARGLSASVTVTP
jgi:hypothetical protein